MKMTQRTQKVNIDKKKKFKPTGQIDVPGIFMEHSHEIFQVYSEKVPYEVPGNNPK